MKQSNNKNNKRTQRPQGGRSGARMNAPKNRAQNAKTAASKPANKPAKPKKKPSASTPSEHTQVIQWYPGHMTKTKRRIEKDLKLVDAVAEIIDARIPISSRNPDIANLTSGKPRVVLLNKCDMADPRATDKCSSFASMTSRPQSGHLPSTSCDSVQKLSQGVQYLPAYSPL